MFAQRAADKLFSKLDGIQYGCFELVTPDGQTRIFEGREKGPKAHLKLHDWRVLPNLAAKGDMGFADDYRAGHWESPNLQNLLSFALANGHALENYIHGSKLMQLGARLAYFMRGNTKAGSRRNIHEHYDLGNEFYRLWLDRGMTYSSAMFKNQNESLEAAQNNKYDRILDRLGRKSGSVLEIGCGWGGFAERAHLRGDHHVRGITLSNEQRSYAANRLGRNAHIALQDYRDQAGKFDSIVSIEMFEAVGERYWPTYFQKLASLLKKDGKAMIQTITIGEEHFERYRKGGDMIRSFVFPGGMLPTPERFEAEAKKAGLKVTDKFAFGQDYAKTLEMWLENFDAMRASVKDQGFDDAFIRMWRLYLSACIAGFKTGRTDVMQMELTHA